MAGRVIIVDDSAINRHLLGQLLRFLGAEVLEADGGRTAIDMISREPVDLVMLDIRMPDLDGFEVLSHLKSDPELSHIPVVMVSALDDSDAAVRCLEMGAEDYVNKPYEPTVLKARMRACLEKKHLRDREREILRQMMTLKQDLALRNDELVAANRKLGEFAFTDSLTGIPNRRCAMDTMTRLWSASDRSKRPLSCLLVDIDQLQKFNDTFGNEAGDRVIQLTAKTMTESVRACDVVSRFGGGRFILLFPDTDGPSLMVAAERLRRLVAEALHARYAQTITISLGGAERIPKFNGYADLINGCDDALESAKAQGRNCSALFNAPGAPGAPKLSL